MDFMSVLDEYKIGFESVLTFTLNEFEVNREALISKIGVYILNDENGTPLYVGYSSSLDARIYAHLCGNSNTKDFVDKFHNVVVIFSSNVTADRITEMILIKELDTIINLDNFKEKGLERFNSVMEQKERLIENNSWYKEKIKSSDSESKLKSNLKVILAKKDMRQKELAEKMGETNQLVSGWVTGSSKPTLIKAFRLAKLLDVEVEDIWTYKEEE